jgi:alpha-L-fucosidase 2
MIINKGKINILIACLLLIPGAGMQADDLKIVYTQPANGWLESIPLGNGRIGAMLGGGIDEERIILNESSLYSRESSSFDTLPDITRYIDMLNQLIRNGDYTDADDYATRHVTGPAVPCYQPLGDLLLQFERQKNVNLYKRELDLTQARALVSYQAEGVGYTREVFVSHPENTAFVRLKSNKKGQLNFSICMESKHPNLQVEVGKKDIIFSGQLPSIALRRTFEWVEEWRQEWKYPEIWDKEGNRRPEVTAYKPDPNTKDQYPVLYNGKGIRFEVRVQVLQCDGTVSAETNRLTIRKAGEVVLAVAVASSFNGFDKDPVVEGLNTAEQNKAVLAKIGRKSFSQLRNNHIRDYQRLFNRVSLQIPPSGKANLNTGERKKNYVLAADPSFAATYFQFGRYLLISCSREGGQPANLQGIWNVDIIPPWGCAYTTNINMQMNYWAAESANLSECHEPVFRFLQEASVTGSRVASQMYRRPGWTLHHNTSIWRGAHPVDWYGAVSYWPMASGWLCRHLWQHYQYTQDSHFLKETAYPLLKGAAQFYNAWLADDGQGHYVTPVSVSPENTFIYIDEHEQRKSAGISMATTLDIAIIRELFSHTIEAERLLWVEDGISSALSEKLTKLYPYRIGQQGQLLEYFKEFIPSPPRHNTSPYYPLYPGSEFTLEKNAAYAQAVRTLMLSRTASRPGGGGWVGAWYAALWARLGESERIPPYMEGLIDRTHLNLFSGGGNVFQIDANLGYTAAVVEMLLQSYSGIVKLLPALPGVWPSGSVSGLCAEGGLEVSMEWKDRQLVHADIRSKTTQRTRIHYRDQSIEVDLKPGQTIRLDNQLHIFSHQ